MERDVCNERTSETDDRTSGGGLRNYGVIAGLWGESEDGVQVDWALRKRRVVGAGGSLACALPPR